MRSLLHRIKLLSYHTHNLVFSDTRESWCSRAWRLHAQSRLWCVLLVVCGPQHCLSSYLYYHQPGDPSVRDAGIHKKT